MKKSPITELVKQLKKDKAYRQSWIANIAMAYIDSEAHYKRNSPIFKKYLNREDRHIISNNAAEYFLKMLCDEIKYPKGR